MYNIILVQDEKAVENTPHTLTIKNPLREHLYPLISNKSFIS